MVEMKRHSKPQISTAATYSDPYMFSTQ